MAKAEYHIKYKVDTSELTRAKKAIDALNASLERLKKNGVDVKINLSKNGKATNKKA